VFEADTNEPTRSRVTAAERVQCRTRRTKGNP
jgi:hypothetical protein